MARLSPAQIYQVALEAGFPPDTAVKMVAIAMKESGGDTLAHNSRPPDDSYGLWQINMLGTLGAARMSQYGLADKADLFDPAVNARVAFDLWAGNDSNLDRHWAIVRSPLNRERYQSFLVVAQSARETFELAQSSGPPSSSPPVANPTLGRPKPVKAARMKPPGNSSPPSSPAA